MGNGELLIITPWSTNITHMHVEEACQSVFCSKSLWPIATYYNYNSVTLGSLHGAYRMVHT